MTKLIGVPATFFVTVVLGGCQPRYNCLPEYETSSPTTIYKYTSYPYSSSAVSSETWVESTPIIRSFAPAPIIRPWWNRPVYTNNGYYNMYGTSYYGGGYSGPAFRTPPMQPLPYPTEWYYPFKRPSPGIYVPGNSSYYTTPSSYYSSPMPIF